MSHQREQSALLRNAGKSFSATRDDATMEEIHSSDQQLHKPCSISQQPTHSTHASKCARTHSTRTHSEANNFITAVLSQNSVAETAAAAWSGEKRVGGDEKTLCNDAIAIMSGGNKEVKLMHPDNRGSLFKLFSRFPQPRADLNSHVKVTKDTSLLLVLKGPVKANGARFLLINSIELSRAT